MYGYSTALCNKETMVNGGGWQYVMLLRCDTMNLEGTTGTGLKMMGDGRAAMRRTDCVCVKV